MELICKGYWNFCKDRLNTKFLGELIVDDNGVYILKFFSEKFNIDKESSIDVINGFTDKGEVTLYMCNIYNSGFNISNAGRIVSYEVLIKYVFLGITITNLENLKLNNLKVRLDNLEEWTRFNSIKKEGIDDENKIEIKISYEPICVQISEKIELEIFPNIIEEGRKIFENKIHIYENSYIQVKSNTGKDISFLIDILRYMKKFVALGLSKAINPIEYSSNINGKSFKILFNEYKSKQYENVNYYNILFTLKDIKDDYNIIKEWYNMRENLEPIFNLYFGVMYNSDIYYEQKFLNLIQALESYHRRTEGNSLKFEKGEFNELICRIKNIFNNDKEKHYIEFIDKVFNHSNELSLRDRLNNILKQKTGSVIELSSKKKKAIIQKICDVRNYYTHFDKSLEVKMLTSSQIISLCDFMILILQTCILIDLGFKEDKIKMLYFNKNILYFSEMDNNIQNEKISNIKKEKCKLNILLGEIFNCENDKYF